MNRRKMLFKSLIVRFLRTFWKPTADPRTPPSPSGPCLKVPCQALPYLTIQFLPLLFSFLISQLFFSPLSFSSFLFFLFSTSLYLPSSHSPFIFHFPSIILKGRLICNFYFKRPHQHKLLTSLYE